MKTTLLFSFGLLATITSASEIQPFEATYEIIRGGKTTGTLTTLLEKISDDRWTIKDTIVGTSGMASFIGFKRVEKTEFIYDDKVLLATHHEMNQKAAFSNKTYTFNWQPESKQYQIQHKGQLTQYEPKNKQVISSQMMPLALALAACQQNTKIELQVLKNKSVTPYQFNISNNKTLIAERIYSNKTSKKTESWLDPKRQCLPSKQSHQVKDNPTILTKLTSFKWL
ncbi:hypothetical protein [Marinicella litoralis]|uniref:DUF3108 domain-containing protein n=1 Tax=Marinicella litoralis TaxID=644220 RepID=A0A4R6XGQ7_9GAMM|nr:hypothetical protein [Marinicella litoralis]TDR16273.1 hypothetical protein C8D91_2799 [Marinicella litoralis]